MMHYTTSNVRRYILRLPKGELFTTRDCLFCGKRNAVDQALFRLVKSGDIVRLARGVFVRDYFDRPEPSAEAVASIKAESFGKQITSHGGTLAQEHKLACEPTDKLIFAINGSSSSFRYGDTTIYFKRTCQRKISLQESKAGKAIVALWHLGKQRCDRIQIMHACDKFNRLDRAQFREFVPRTPAWLSDYFAA